MSELTLFDHPIKLTYRPLILLLGFLFLFYLFNWNTFNAPFERDEGEYAYGAMLLRQGDFPYQNTFLQKPPLIIYTYWVGQLVNSTATWPPRLVAGLFALVTTCFVGWIARREWGSPAGWIAVFLYLPMSMFPVLTPFAANTEKFMLLPLMSLVALYVYIPQPQQARVWLFSGILSVLAIGYKPIALPVVLAIYALWGWRLYQNHTQLPIIGKYVSWTLLGGLLAGLLITLPILRQEAFSDFWEQVVVFNHAYASTSGFALSNFFSYLGKFTHFWWIIFLTIVLFYHLRPPRWPTYTLLTIAALLGVITSPMGHYYLLVVPFLSLMTTAAIIYWAKMFKPELTGWVQCSLTAGVILIIVFPFRQQFYLSPSELTTWVYGTVNPFTETPIIANHIAQLTQPTDPVFVAGSEPELYFYAQRVAPTRFNITYPLNLDTPFRERYQNELVNNLTTTRPKLIVLSRRPHSGLWNEGSPTIFLNFLTKTLSENYHTVGAYVWDNFGGYWQNNPTDEQILQASYILYLLNE